MSDALVHDAQKGDRQAFAKLVEEYYRPIYGLAFSALGNWQAAEDVAQDAFLVAWVNIAKLRTVDAFGAWLRRIARNLACNWIRSECYRRALLERREIFQAGATPCTADRGLARADAVAETWAALEKLSPPLREAVVLYYLEENSIAQTAAVLGITENAVKKRLQHARPLLRRYFEEQWKAEMDRERRRINASEAGRRFTAGAALGPVAGLAGKLGSGAGLWLHGALRGEGTGRLASLLSFDSAVAKPVTILLLVMTVSGVGMLWNSHGRQLAVENAPRVSEAAKPMPTAAQAGTGKATPETRIQDKGPSDGNAVPESGWAAAGSAQKKAPVGTVTVSGHVVDEEQNPIQGATVTVVASGLDISATEPAVAFGGAGGVSGGMSGGIVSGGSEVVGGSSGGGTVTYVGTPPFTPEDPRQDALDNALLDEARRFSAVSSSDGSFSIANVPDDGLLIVSVDAPGFCLQGTTMAGTHSTDVTLTLSPGFSVQGRLLGAEGGPVADTLLQVTALAWNREGSAGGWNASPQYWGWKRTDGTGRFTLTLKDPGSATVAVRSRAEGKATLQGVRVEPGAVAELRLPRQSTVGGKITQHDGTPASGVILLLTAHSVTNVEDEEHGVKAYGMMAGPAFKASTDGAGAYRIAGIDPQMRYTVNLCNDDMTPLATGIDLEPVGAGQNLLWNYTIPRPIVVKGVATEQASGRPAVGANIFCSDADEAAEDGFPMRMPAAQATTGPDGAYEMRITARPGNYVFGIPTVTGFRPLAQREVREGESVVLNLVLPGSCSRSFLVVDAAGKPLPGVSVAVQAEGSDMRVGYPGKTGDDGRIRVTHLTAGDRVKCIFQYESHEAESEVLQGQEGTEFPEEIVVIDLSK